MLGRPSETLFTTFTSGTPASYKAVAVPRVASIWKPFSCISLANSITRALSLFRTDNNALPERGNGADAPRFALA